MTFKEEMKERTEVIEKLLVKYLPKAEGYQSQIMEAMEYSVMAGRKETPPNADAGDIPPFRRRRKRNRAVYGSNGDDPYLFPGTR